MKFTLDGPNGPSVGNGVVPFGKYKGQPVEVLMADDGYRDWLLAQPWFRERHSQIYQVVINYGGESSETPEHNQMQALFLDDAFCLALTKVAWQRRLSALPQWAMTWAEHLRVESEDHIVAYSKFEVDGWDVQFATEPAAWNIEVSNRPECTCRPCDHSGCGERSKCRGGDGIAVGSPYPVYSAVRCKHRPCEDRSDRIDGSHCDPECLGHPADHYREIDKGQFQSCLRSDGQYIEREARKTAHVELKPDLGDDYPAVLRQVLSYKTTPYGRRCVVARRHRFEYVSWEQVRKMFRASEVYLISESEIT